MNGYGSIAQRLALCLVSLFATILHGGEMVLLGTHPTSPATAFPEIHVLKAYQGRIYMGYGDWNLYPAVVVVSYDLGTASFRPEFSAPTDSVGVFRVVRGDLYVPSIDPVHFEEFADFSVRSGGVWRRYAPAGFFHVFDVATLTGDDLWFVGAKSANETSTVDAAVWRSLDDGRTWTDVTIASSQFRYYYSFPLRGKFYVHDTVYDGTGATRVAAAPYPLFYKPLPLGSGTNEIVVGIAQLTAGIGGFSRQSLVRYDTVNWQTLKANVIDLTVAESLLYTLDYNPASGSNELWVAAFNGQMQPTWMRLPLSNVPANAKAIEVLEDRIYVGNTAGQLWVGEIDGSPAAISSATIVNELRDGFGRAIAADASSLAIGSPEFSGGAIMSGQVTVWKRTGSGSGAASWTEPQTIVPPQPSFSGWFGKDVAIGNGVLVVLEAGTDISGWDRGGAAQVHLYENTAQGWQFRQTIVRPYAHALALQSNVLWVATSTLLHRYALGPGPATLAESFSSGAPAAMYAPAARVAGDTNRVAFGVTGDSSRGGGPGQVNVYERQAGVWRRVSTLLQNSAPLPPGLAYHPDAFGFAVALAGDWLAVGAPRDDTAAWQAGAVHLYQRVINGANISYVQRQKIVAPLSQQEANFGTSVAFVGDYLVIGTPGVEQASNRRRGFVHVYRLEGTNAVSVGSLPAPVSSETEFGTKVFLDGDTIIAGSRTSTTNVNELERVLFRRVGDVGPPPLITNLPVTQTVSPGAVPSFSVGAIGDGSLAYQWFHNDTPIAGATNATLSMPPVVSAHAGRYTVRVSSPNGQTTSQPAVLTLFSIHPSKALEIAGPVGQAYRIDARTEFSQINGWITITNLILPSSPLLFSDPASSNALQRFYRAIALQ